MKRPLFSMHALKGLFVVLAATFVLGTAALTIVFNGNLSDMVAAATSTISSPPVLVFFTPYDGGSSALTVGQNATIDFDVDARVPINSIGASLAYPKDSLEVVSFSKERSFLDLWTQDTTIKEADGELDFSGGTTKSGGMTGTSTVLTLTVRAKKAGDATLSVGSVQVYAADGKGTPLDTSAHSLTFHIASAPATSTGAGGTNAAAVPQPTPPSPDLNGDGKVTILDVSKLMIEMVAPYNPRYDLNGDGRVGLSDLSVLFSKLGSR